MDEYDKITASHYAAYRPPLHATILNYLLGGNRYDGVGLDVGCGTGQSAIALTNHCRRVIALDPSVAMLAVAPAHPSVEFRQQTEVPLAQQLPGLRFDLVSFAGSLFYQDTTEVGVNLPGLLAPAATVVVYDFDVDLGTVFTPLDFTPPTGDYDHQRGLGAHHKNGLSLKKEWTGKLHFPAAAVELAHLVCSVSSWREALLKGGPFERLVGKIEMLFSGNDIELQAECFGKVYEYVR